MAVPPKMLIMGFFVAKCRSITDRTDATSGIAYGKDVGDAFLTQKMTRITMIAGGISPSIIISRRGGFRILKIANGNILVANVISDIRTVTAIASFTDIIKIFSHYY